MAVSCFDPFGGPLKKTHPHSAVNRDVESEIRVWSFEPLFPQAQELENGVWLCVPTNHRLTFRTALQRKGQWISKELSSLAFLAPISKKEAQQGGSPAEVCGSEGFLRDTKTYALVKP